MAFSWNTPVSGGVKFSTTLDETISELKNNIDHVYSQQRHPAWTWTEIPVGEGTYMEFVDINDLRGAIDHIHGNLSCIADCSNHFITHLGTQKDNYDVTKYFTHDNVHKHTVLGTNNGTYQASHNITHRITYYTTEWGTHKHVVLGTHNVPYYNGHLASYDSTDRVPHNPTHYGQYWSGIYCAGLYYASANKTVQGSYL